MSDLSFDAVSELNIGTFKKLAIVLFPVLYSPSFYKQTIGGNIKGFIVKKGSSGAIGCICWRVKEGKTVELLMLGVLVLHRRQGVGAGMIHFLMNNIPEEEEEILLAVQTSNEDAVSFYKRHGFQVARTLERYYPRLQPPDAFEMVKALKRS